MTSLQKIVWNNFIGNHHSESGKSFRTEFRLQNEKIYDSLDTASFQKQQKNIFSKNVKNYLYYSIAIYSVDVFTVPIINTDYKRTIRYNQVLFSPVVYCIH